MNMVRHNDEGIQFYIYVISGQIMPARRDYSAIYVQLHLCIDNLAEYRFTIVCANGEKIRA